MKPDIGSESWFLPIPPAFDAPVRGVSRRNIAMQFGTEKLELCGYTLVKKMEDIFIRFDRMHERDGRTEGRTDGRTDRHRILAKAKMVAIDVEYTIFYCEQ